MKLTILLSIVFMHASAAGLTQKITLTEKNSPLKRVFSEIRKQTGYGFLYTEAVLNESKLVSLSVKNATVEETLDLIFKNQPISYSIEDKTVILKLNESRLTASVVITGRVVGDKSVPLQSVSVKVKDAATGTTTDAQGNYRITVEEDATLVFSYLGYNTEEVNVRGKTIINVVMTLKEDALGEVVVVAYGTVRKGESTSSTAQVNYEQFKNRPLTNIASALEGAAPGIQSLSASGQPGEAPAIRVRGFGSINADQNPLYVVDGAIYDGGLSNFNMEDVESITVLKDAASTALYGSRGANGVIIITTKSGKKSRNGLSFKVSQGIVSRALPEYDRVDAFEYYPLMWQAYRNLLISSGQTEAVASQNATNGIKAQLGYNPFNVPDSDIVRTDGTLNPNAKLLYADDLDWAAPIERLGQRQEYSVGLTGSNDKSNYYASFGYLNEKGFLKNSDQNRFMGRLNATAQPLNWFRAGINMSGTLTGSSRSGLSASTRIENPFFFARTIGPIYPVYLHNPATGEYILDATGKRIYDQGAAMGPGLPLRPGAAYGGRHSIQENELDREMYSRNYTGARSFAEISFLKNFKITANISADITNFNNSIYSNNVIGPNAPAGLATKENVRTTSYTFNQLLNYTKSFDLHNLSVLAGHENYSRKIETSETSRTSQIVANNYELDNFAVVTSATSFIDNYRVESYLSRLNYNFDGKYFLSASLRADGNSRFHPDRRWETFYSLGLAWRIDRESFMANNKIVNSLRLRASYGRVGNDAGIGYYPYQALYALGFNNGTEPGIRQSNVPNTDITWEGQKSIDAAVEFGIFKNRITGTVEYYNRISDDLIFDVPLPLSLGGYSVFKNIGALVNKGWELQLSGDVIKRQAFTWNIGLNASTLKNEITRMPADRPEIVESGSFRKLAVGRSIYDYWMYEFKGVDPSDGMSLYGANNTSLASNIIKGGDTLTKLQSNAKFVYSGSAIPDFYGSLTTRLSYKGLEFSALFSYQIGGKIYDAPYASLMHNGTYGTAWHRDILRAWQKPGDETDVPRLLNGEVNVISNRYLTDASFLSVRSVGLSYNLPKEWIAKINARGARIYVNGENLHWFSARKGMNVQQSFTGITSNVYVPAKTFTLGLNVDF